MSADVEGGLSASAGRSPVLAHLAALISSVALVVWVVGGLEGGPAGLYPWGLPILVFAMTTIVVGWSIAWRRPGISLGWILIGIGFLFALQGPTEVLGRALLPSPAGTWLLAYGGSNSQWSWFPPVALLFTQLPLRFPTGSLPSPRWRWFSAFTVVAIVIASAGLATTGTTVDGQVANPFLVPWQGSQVMLLTGVLLLFAGPAFVGSIVSLFIRYHRAGRLERTQLRWVFLAEAVVTGMLIVSALSTNDQAPGIYGVVSRFVEFLVSLGYSLIPVAIMVAVLRYRLFEIDRIISRTAAYALVTALTIGTYLVVTLVISLLLPSTRQQTPPIVIALATLAAAAVFLPALRWVRRAIDRVFNRSQYDAERVVLRFGEHIRNGADPHTAGDDLLDAVGATLQPSAIGLWVQEEER